MPSKRKASDVGGGSPSKRAALTCTTPHGRETPTRQAPAATPKVRRTYGKQQPVMEEQGTIDVMPKPKSQTETEPEPEADLPPPSPVKTCRQRRRKQTNAEESPPKRRPKRIKADQKPNLTSLETPRRAKRTTNVFVEVLLPPRPAATPQPQPFPPQVESQDAPLTPPKPKRTMRPQSPSKSQFSLSSSKQLPLQFYPCLNAQKRVTLRSLHNPATFTDTEENTGAEKTAKHQLLNLLNGTIARSEGNSCLLLGPRGSGKSKVGDFLLNFMLVYLQSYLQILDECLKSLPQTPIIIRLSGCIHQTDRLAMREIAYQLGQQTGKTFLQAEEEETDDFVEQDDNPFLDRPDSAEVAEIGLAVPPSSHLPALISVIPTLSRPTVVILDAFDLFALHPRQALLYCLLDTVQGCRASMDHKGLAVVGITTRIDTVNLLEKRVKSRFSGRVTHTMGIHTTQSWLSLIKKALCSQVTPVNIDNDLVDEWNNTWEKRVSMFLDEKEVVEVIRDTVGLAKDPRLLSRILVSHKLPLVVHKLRDLHSG